MQVTPKQERSRLDICRYKRAPIILQKPRHHRVGRLKHAGGGLIKKGNGERPSARMGGLHAAVLRVVSERLIDPVRSYY